MLLKPTFKLHLQHLVLIVNDVSIWVEGVAGTVHTDFQTQISSWWQTNIEKRIVNLFLKKEPKSTVSPFHKTPYF